MLKCDVLVIGAGISGMIAAAKLAKDGKKVIVIEKLSKVGEHTLPKIDITESHGLEEIFSDLGIETPHASNTSVWYSPHYKLIFKSKISDFYIIRGTKGSFGQHLFSICKKHGVRFLFNSSLKSFRQTDNEVISSIASNGKKEEISSLFLIEASGSRSIVRKLLGITPKRTVTIAAYGQTLRGLNIPANETYIFLDSGYAPGGYVFIGKTKGDFGVASVVVNQAKAKKSLKNYLSEFLKNNQVAAALLSGAKKDNEFQGSCAVSQVDKQTFGKVLLTGDAAGTIDPLFAYGVRPSIISGYLVAKSIIENNTTSYEKNLQEALLDSNNKSWPLRRFADRLSNSDFDFIVKTLDKISEKTDLDEFFEKPSSQVGALLKSAVLNPVSSSQVLAKLALSFFV